ncbi:hypothetical protein ACPCUX_05595 [Cellulosimicrobium sp. AB352]|uniref:hypothetical protein n=1 Tax=Cellulosimicrobium sp. AB352 TaxID=3413281 RepID=UPI003C1BDD1B
MSKSKTSGGPGTNQYKVQPGGKTQDEHAPQPGGTSALAPDEPLAGTPEHSSGFAVVGWDAQAASAALSRLESMEAGYGYRDEGAEEEALWALGDGDPYWDHPTAGDGPDPAPVDDGTVLRFAEWVSDNRAAVARYESARAEGGWSQEATAADLAERWWSENHRSGSFTKDMPPIAVMEDRVERAAVHPIGSGGNLARFAVTVERAKAELKAVEALEDLGGTVRCLCYGADDVTDQKCPWCRARDARDHDG